MIVLLYRWSSGLSTGDHWQRWCTPLLVTDWSRRLNSASFAWSDLGHESNALHLATLCRPSSADYEWLEFHTISSRRGCAGMADRHIQLADILEGLADSIGSRLAIVAGESRRTYAELDDRATRLANHLAAQWSERPEGCH